MGGKIVEPRQLLLILFFFGAWRVRVVNRHLHNKCSFVKGWGATLPTCEALDQRAFVVTVRSEAPACDFSGRVPAPLPEAERRRGCHGQGGKMRISILRSQCGKKRPKRNGRIFFALSFEAPQSAFLLYFRDRNEGAQFRNRESKQDKAPAEHRAGGGVALSWVCLFYK